MEKLLPFPEEEIKTRMFQLHHIRKRLISSLKMFNSLIHEADTFIGNGLHLERIEPHSGEDQNCSDVFLESQRKAYTKYMEEFEAGDVDIINVIRELQDIEHRQGKYVRFSNGEIRYIQTTFVLKLNDTIKMCTERLTTIKSTESAIYKRVDTVLIPSGEENLARVS